MRRCVLIFAIALAGAPLYMRPAPAEAGLNFCNLTAESVQIAVGWANPEASGSRGWFVASPGGCVTPIETSLDPTYRYFYWAQTLNNLKIWQAPKGEFLCVDFSQSFYFPSGADVPTCSREYFLEVKYRDMTNWFNPPADWTVTLS